MVFLRSVFSVGSFTILSRVTGYCRELLMIHLVGVSMLSDALIIAIKIPTFFRRIFAEGAFHVSFLPLFTESKQDKNFAGMILTCLFLMMGICTFWIEWKFSWLSQFLLGKMTQKTETLWHLQKLGPIIFPYVFFISLASFFGSILNAYGRFSLLAASHAIGNLAVIVLVVFCSFHSHNYGLIFAWAICLSGAIQLVTVFFGCWQLKYLVPMRWPKTHPLIKKFFYNFLPGLLSIGVIQLNIIIGIFLASRYLPSGSISYLSYADRFNQLPLSIIGVSLSSVLLPLLSYHIKKNDTINTHKIQNQAMRFVFLMTLPMMTFLITLSFPIILLLFGHGKLSLHHIQEISKTLAAYATGVPAYILIKILNTRFFAHGQTKIPLCASFIGVCIDVLISLLLIGTLKHIGIAFAVSIAAWSTMAFLLFMLHRKYKWKISRPLWNFGARLLGACSMTGLCLIGLQRYVFFMPQALGKQIFIFSALVLLGIICLLIFFVVYGLLNRKQWRIFTQFFKERPSYVTRSS